MTLAAFLDAREARGALNTPVTAYGLAWDPQVASQPLVADLKGWQGWHTIEPSVFDLSTPLWATEARVSSRSIEDVTLRNEPFRPGYDPAIVIDAQGRAVVIDGHHRLAMHLAKGDAAVAAHVLDLRVTPRHGSLHHSSPNLLTSTSAEGVKREWRESEAFGPDVSPLLPPTSGRRPLACRQGARR